MFPGLRREIDTRREGEMGIRKEPCKERSLDGSKGKTRMI